MTGMKQSSKTAFGGILTALSVVLMFLTGVIPFLTFALPALAGALLILIVMEIGSKWALCVYAAVSILSLLVVADKEAAMMYAAFFGYYPVIKSFLESKLPRVFEWIVKFLIFNAAMVLAYLVIILCSGCLWMRWRSLAGMPCRSCWGWGMWFFSFMILL